MNVKEQVVAKMTSFPTLPVMVHKLLAVAGDVDAGINEVAEVVAYDAALTANILKAANSAFLGYHKRVDSLTEAAIRLGTKWIIQMAVSSLIYSNIKRPAPGYDLSAEDLWRHSAAVAIMSDNLCKLLEVKETGMIYTAALLHDMGKFALGEFVSESFDDIQAKVDEDNISFEEAEEKILGIDHAEVGALIGENWNFPSHIIAAIRWHHNPSGMHKAHPAVDIVHLADAVCLMEGLGIGRDGLQYHPDERAIARLNLSSAILEKATSQVIDSLEEIENIFDEAPMASMAGR